MTPRRVRALQIAITAVAVIGGSALLFLPWWWVGRHLHGGIDLEAAPHEYAAGEPAACAPGSRPGPAGRSRSEGTAEGVAYLVETPTNYDALRAHPLIVVYAPHGVNRFLSERFVGLTHAATGAGFVVVYADSHPLEPRRLAELGRIPDEVVKRWCIDPARVFFTGHSDGGTAATALAVLGGARPAAIAPSAAGFRREDLAAYACPPPLSVMVLQNRDDELFPGFGRGAADWWAECNGCDRKPSAPRADGCVEYPSCHGRAKTVFCEGDGTHLDWPDRNQAIVDFFLAASRN